MARTKDKAEDAKLDILSEVPSQSPTAEDDNIITMGCDHTSFESIRQFCSELRHMFDGEPENSENVDSKMRRGIDVMCLNAGVLTAEAAAPQFTVDDFEISFQTNHLAPFLIANLLGDMINPCGRVVVTTSGLHEFCKLDNFVGMVDPETGSAKKRFEMINSEPFDYKRCYAASKLCNVIFSVELNARLREKNAVATCFTPGLIPTSGLFRNQQNWKEAMDKKKAAGMDETIEWGGCVLAWVSLSEEAGKSGGCFWRAPYGISNRGGRFERDLYSAKLCEEAANSEYQEKLWDLSCKMVGISQDLI